MGMNSESKLNVLNKNSILKTRRVKWGIQDLESVVFKGESK